MTVIRFPAPQVAGYQTSLLCPHCQEPVLLLVLGSGDEAGGNLPQDGREGPEDETS
jgi:hypothetical protein